MPEKIADQDHGAHPEDAAEDIESEVASVGHSGGAGYRRTEGSNDGNKAGENHRASAILFVKIVGALEVASPEKERVFATVQCCARRAADPITNLVPHDGAEHHGQEQPLQRDDAGSGEYSCGNKKGIAGKKESYKKSSFDKDDHTDKGRAARAD